MWIMLIISRPWSLGIILILHSTMTSVWEIFETKFRRSPVQAQLRKLNRRSWHNLWLKRLSLISLLVDQLWKKNNNKKKKKRESRKWLRKLWAKPLLKISCSRSRRGRIIPLLRVRGANVKTISVWSSIVFVLLITQLVDPSVSARNFKRMEFATIIKSIKKREGRPSKISLGGISMLSKKKLIRISSSIWQVANVKSQNARNDIVSALREVCHAYQDFANVKTVKILDLAKSILILDMLKMRSRRRKISHKNWNRLKNCKSSLM